MKGRGWVGARVFRPSPAGDPIIAASPSFAVISRARSVARRALALLLVALLLPGCSTARRVPLDASLPVASPAQGQTGKSTVKKVRIAGYTTAIDSTFHECEGYVSALGADSLRFEVFKSPGDRRSTILIVPRHQIQSLLVKEASGGKSLLLVLGVVAGFAAMVALALVVGGGDMD